MFIPKLLKRHDVPEKDKKHLQMLKEQRKWNRYTMRHSSITKLARDPNINDYVLRQHCGWSKRSEMVEIYTHELKGDSLEHVMMAYGINLKDKNKKQNERMQQEMVGPHCPFCKMVNVPDTQFCSSCHKPLSLVSMNKIMEEPEAMKKQKEASEKSQQRMMEFMKMVETKLAQVDKQLQAQNSEMREALS
jgi:hypothetical protein